MYFDEFKGLCNEDEFLNLMVDNHGANSSLVDVFGAIKNAANTAAFFDMPRELVDSINNSNKELRIGTLDGILNGHVDIPFSPTAFGIRDPRAAFVILVEKIDTDTYGVLLTSGLGAPLRWSPLLALVFRPREKALFLNCCHKDLSPEQRDKLANSAIQWLLSCLTILDLEPTVIHKNVVAPALQKARAKAGKPPLVDYNVCKIKMTRGVTGLTRAVSERNAPRPHPRRGHPRVLPSGNKTWVKATFIGAGDAIKNPSYIIKM